MFLPSELGLSARPGPWSETSGGRLPVRATLRLQGLPYGASKPLPYKDSWSFTLPTLNHFFPLHAFCKLGFKYPQLMSKDIAFEMR